MLLRKPSKTKKFKRIAEDTQWTMRYAHCERLRGASAVRTVMRRYWIRAKDATWLILQVRRLEKENAKLHTQINRLRG